MIFVVRYHSGDIPGRVGTIQQNSPAMSKLAKNKSAAW